jgi:hypothetical protein
MVMTGTRTGVTNAVTVARGLFMQYSVFHSNTVVISQKTLATIHSRL